MYTLSLKSHRKLKGVDKSLAKVVRRAIVVSNIDFGVIEGVRDAKRQAHLVNIGASHKLNSKHIYGKAVDLVAYDQGEISWSWPLYFIIAEAMKEAAYELDVEIVWGGDWNTFKDGPHFELANDN